MMEIVQFSNLKNCLASELTLLSLHIFAMTLSVAELPQFMKVIPERDKALENAGLANICRKLYFDNHS